MRHNKLKRDIIEIQSQENSIEKGNTRKILNKKENMKKNKYAENLQRKREHKKANMMKILNKNENIKKQIRGKS